MQFRQLFESESYTLTYILWDKNTMDGVVIDPVIETFARDTKLIDELGINVKYILETHVHADHITSAKSMRNKTGAQIVLGSNSGVSPDVLIEDGDEISFGKYSIKAIHTPGHTNGCTSYYTEGMAFTGDTLLIRGCGRTDFQEGSNKDMFHSVREKLFNLPDDTLVYPAHDYEGRTCSTIKEEKEYNPRLKISNSYEDFEKIMNELKLDYPKKIKESLPANKELGK